MKKKNTKENIFKRLIQKFKIEDDRTKKIFGFIFLFLSIYVFVVFVSYLLNGNIDQDKTGKLTNDISNIGGVFGNTLSHLFLRHYFGISSFIFPLLFFNWGLSLVFDKTLFSIKKGFSLGILAVVWISLFFGFFTSPSILGGVFGSEMNEFLALRIGKIGNGFFIFLSLLTFIIIRFNPKFKFTKSSDDKQELPENNEIADEEFSLSNELDFQEEEQEPIIEPISQIVNPQTEDNKEEITPNIKQEESNDLGIEVHVNEEDILSQKDIKTKLEELGDYDPKLDLSNYKIPAVNLLNDYGSGKIEIDKSELEANKNRIVETLANYKIGISSISATIGPTITLYEIVPEAGIRISKIKNLEDDIALSLSALGIRIIAPIPGKGTIGIEVPNQKPTTVSMKAVISSDKFQNSEMELPVAFGKTISNETFVADLAKMPHLLMAGATGQGKSVGLNAILASLLYKKHPAQVKFVLVDPKKVELTLFNKIERHFLAKLPDSEEAIITDTKKVINTLNSLCIEMDQRYDLLQNAQCRNIVEYNKKFIARKLNPNDGHKYLPYIVLVIDEFADLIMTAGKEVETPIARLAQLARAIGIHLIVATQRPSVNVITGIIKANFPARVAFRVTSKIDSRTILDAGGADQLIGRGDMLISLGSDLIRLQCAFIDTPEVEKITDFIGNQRAYPEAFLLPEYIGDAEGGTSDADLDDRDVMFEQAARVVVQHQSGSTSLIQRKLKLGYNRAGRIIDQLETARIVGPFEGSKARQVLIRDEMALEEVLNELNNPN
ncbi:MAG: DNA translocase FtsK 4TM domain-containing protein [Flavobacteriales bacterium]|nr:DNA translocase FtsK 4TM domain-containing protein [Flavobacteriales bacterium]